jgi:hypothetical protein
MKLADRIKPGQGPVGQAERAERDHQIQLLSDVKASVDDMRTGLQESVSGIALTASEAKPVTAGVNPFRVATSTVRLIGWSLENGTTTPVIVRFRAVVSQGDVVGSDVIASVRLDAGGTSSMRIGTTGGVQAEGLVLEIAPVAGGSGFTAVPTILGSVHLGRVD